MAASRLRVLLWLCVVPCLVQAYNNGVARTPPMGWLAWERFRCNTDCENFPNSCINEKLFMDMADRLAEDGWRDHGYTLVNIDDCWSERMRNSKSELEANHKRFPKGIPALVEYVHSKGLKLGIYADMGSLTCAGYPGSIGYEKIDAQTFANWKVDMVKYDGCSSNSTEQAVGYPLMSKELNATGRQMIYSCEWPLYQGGLPPKVNYTYVGEICNMWRNHGDIDDSFDAVLSIIKWWGDNQDVLVPAAGPGKWNDPDMLVGGDFSLSFDESRVQFGMWAILAAPLLVSVDLRTIDTDIRDKIYFNRRVIDVSQDALGIQGRRVKYDQNYQLWIRPLIGDEYAIAIMSTRIDGTPSGYAFSIAELEIKNPAPNYLLVDIMDDDESKIYSQTELIHTLVNPSGIRMYRATPDRMMQIESVVEIDIL